MKWKFTQFWRSTVVNSIFSVFHWTCEGVGKSLFFNSDIFLLIGAIFSRASRVQLWKNNTRRKVTRGKLFFTLKSCEFSFSFTLSWFSTSVFHSLSFTMNDDKVFTFSWALLPFLLSGQKEIEWNDEQRLQSWSEKWEISRFFCARIFMIIDISDDGTRKVF